MSLRSNAGPMVKGYSGKIHKGCKSREAAIRTWNDACLMHHKHIRPQVNIARAAHPPAPLPPPTPESGVQHVERCVSVEFLSTCSPSPPVSPGTSKPDEIPPLLPVE